MDKLRGFLSLTLCNKANFHLKLSLVKHDVLEKGLNIRKIYGPSTFPLYKSLNDASTPYI